VELFKPKMFHQQFKFMDKGLHLPAFLFGGAASTTTDLVIDDDLAIICKPEKVGHKTGMPAGSAVKAYNGQPTGPL
jgi:hypothetical protein